MTKKSSATSVEESLNGYPIEVQFILAGISGLVREFQVFGLSLQQVSDGAYRCILRGSFKAGSRAGLRLVSFTNGDSPEECLELAGGAFRDGKLRWHVDQYANGAGSPGDSANETKQLTLL